MTNFAEANMSLQLLVVIVNYRTPALTIDCLRSLKDEVQAMSTVQVVVTDNDSGDDSINQIQRAIAQGGWGDWVTMMPLERNGGFAYGNNAAIRPYLQAGTLPPYVLLLNPDTVVRPNALRSLVNFMDQHPTVGIAGSRLEDPDTTPQCSAFRFHTLFSEIDSSIRLGFVSNMLKRWIVAPPVVDEACQTDWVAGASMIIRRDVFETVGLMDEAYFMYYEEMDFCLQANRAGWPCWYVPQSRIVHLVGQSSGVTNTKSPAKRRPQYWFDSRRRYFLKNYGWFYTALADTVWAVGFALWRVRRLIQQKPDSDPPQLLNDFIRNSIFFRGGVIGPAKIG
ncbi:glycosyltransferase family 2 protein [Leptolyngbya sp. AN02str]|uniref:glycosyltransferase family 2 protein n=1 Tax=Leptolyngbya sp. AN02str TaxID=3423363 RepID=UPI003D310842